MDYKYLHNLSYTDLKKIAEGMEIEIDKRKDGLINNILVCFRKYEEYRKEKIDKYKKIKQIGNEGKEGVTYLVKTSEGKQYAMKTFRKTKSSSKLRLEAELQKKAAELQVSPKVIEIDTVSKYIVMEKLDKHLYDVMKEQEGNLTEDQQKDLIHIFKSLDEAKVFHGDSNILNYMYKKNKLYIIDFGMAKHIDSKLKKKLGTDTPNFSLMNLGFILKLKELECPEKAYTYLLTFVTDTDKVKYGLK